MEDLVFRTKHIKFQSEVVSIILQDKNGACPIIAICNYLLLNGHASISLERTTVSSDEMIAMVHKRIEISTECEERKLPIIEMIPKLFKGLDVNPIHTGINSFVATSASDLFSILQIPLHHAYLVDPKDTEMSDIIGSNSFYELAELLSSSEDRIAKVIREFLKNDNQMTIHGFRCLQEELLNHHMGVLFYGLHFSTIYKFDKDIYLLASDGTFDDPREAWQKLLNHTGDFHIMTSDFRRCFLNPDDRLKFFTNHKNDVCIRSQFHPTELVTFIKRRNERARDASYKFLLDMSKKDSYMDALTIEGGEAKIISDCSRAINLVKKLDKEKGLSFTDTLLNLVHTETNPTRRLNLLITYLWKVHTLNFYGMVEEIFGDITHNKEAKRSWSIASSKVFDDAWDSRLTRQNLLDVMVAKKEIFDNAVTLFGDKVTKLNSKYICKIENCSKALDGKFLEKHCDDKHLEYVLKITKYVRENVFETNFLKYSYVDGGLFVNNPLFVEDGWMDQGSSMLFETKSRWPSKKHRSSRRKCRTGKWADLRIQKDLEDGGLEEEVQNESSNVRREDRVSNVEEMARKGGKGTFGQKDNSCQQG